jgi:flagellar hook assembly protein FlgD
LRKSVAAIVLVLVASLGVIVPSAAAATGDPKVVIIVGATHSATPGYRTDADVIYTEAKKYTPNVVKVYSPNATWAAVKAAVVGASVVVYLGHGNGWPSPYAYDPLYTTKDGFGLNATAGNGDYNNKYYGEPSIATLAFAPGALVILNHLCYASGNSEPGYPEPTISVARQRADNYAAGFFKAGAAAVIAEGHAGAESTIRALFTTHQSVEDMWRTMPNENGNIVSFPSSRTPGATVYQDPTTPTSGFYRSLAINTIGVTTDEVVSAGAGDTGTDPASLVVPGNASVATAGGKLYATPDTTVAPKSVLLTGTRLHVVDTATQATATGPAVIAVAGVDDPTITGFMIATDLVPRDSTAPIVRVLDPGGPFSPNGDGQVDQASLRGRFTESVAWTLSVRDTAAHLLFQQTGTGSSFQVAWNGIVGGHPVADGTYAVSVSGIDAWGNGPARASRELTVDTSAPTLASLTPSAATTQWFSPNGDGVRETVAFSATTSEAGAIVASVLDAHGTTVRSWTTGAGTAPVALTWNGRNSAGAFVPDGVYTVRVAGRDLAGNTSTTLDRTVDVIAGLRAVATSKTLFFPQDLDSLAGTTRLSFVLARPMTATWTVRNGAGAVVATRVSNVLLAAGYQGWNFSGRGADGRMLPQGHYTSYVTATDGTFTAVQTVGFDMEAFRVRSSDDTPGRGQSITIQVTSAEPLAANPRLYIYQPGLGRWSVAMVRTGTYTYKATFRLKSGGTAGTLGLRVNGRDIKGGVNNTSAAYKIH